MIYHRIYNNYFHAIEILIHELLKTKPGKENTTIRMIDRLPVNQRFLKLLKSFVDKNLNDIIDTNGHVASLDTDTLAEYPMTILERRWLKSMSLDPRVQLFDIDWSGLDDVEPLYLPNDVVYFDQQNTSDPWNNEKS